MHYRTTQDRYFEVSGGKALIKQKRNTIRRSDKSLWKEQPSTLENTEVQFEKPYLQFMPVSNSFIKPVLFLFE